MVTLGWRFAGILLLSSACPVAAQPPDAARAPSFSEVKDLLQSSRPQHRAWGARLAARDGRSELTPEIVKIAMTHVSGPTVDDHRCTSAALDALIQLGMPPPLDLLSLTYERWPTETLILAARLGELGNGKAADSVLFTLLARERGLVWFGAANLLLAHQARGFVSAVIRDLPLTATLFISSSGSEITSTQPPHVTGDYALGPVEPSYYPDVVDYRLSAWPTTGLSVLSTGPTSIYYQRVVSRGGFGPDDPPDSIATADRLTYAAAAAHVKQLPLSGSEAQGVTWRGAAALEADKRWVQRDVLRRYRDLIHSLREAGVLTQSEAAALPTPAINVVVEDLRPHKSSTP